MPKTKGQKTEILEGLQNDLQNQRGMVFVDYRGLGVPEMNALRKEVRARQGKLQVLKKTLLQRVLNEKGINMDVRALQGQIAAIFVFGDPVEAVKGAYAFAKIQEKLKLIGGYIDGQVLNGETVTAVASIPSKNELLSRLVGSVAAPLSGFLRVAQGPARGLVFALQAIRDNKS